MSVSAHRFFATAPVPEDGPLPLSDGDLHHLRDVLRLGPGDEVVLVHAAAAWRVTLREVGDVASGHRGAAEPVTALPPVVLVQGIGKGDKTDTVVRQVTELGVSTIVPLVAERSVVKLDAARAASRTARWRRIATEAAKQSQRAGVPAVLEPADAEDAARLIAGACVVICWEDALDAPSVGAAIAACGPAPEVPVAVVVGPEGGLTEREVAAFRAVGGVTVSLGPTVLRTETAGVVAAALALAARGGLGYDRV